MKSCRNLKMILGRRKRSPPRHNWVTDIYDKMNISVRSLDIALVVLCAIVVFCFIYGANH